MKNKVYTVGSGSWRTIASSSTVRCAGCSAGAFLNGNLHWVASEVARKVLSIRISCFDLETELFSTFSPPPLHDPCKDRNVSALRDCLCVCDNSPSGYEIDIWLMNEYGDERSWTKEFVIRKDGVEDFLKSFCPSNCSKTATS